MKDSTAENLPAASTSADKAAAVSAASGSARFAGCIAKSPELSLNTAYAGSLLRAQSAAPHVHVSDKLALAAWPGALHGASRHGLRVAVSGRITWSDGALADLCESQGPIEAVAEAFRRDGTAALRHLHGPFAIAICDPGRNAVLAAIDRMGIRSLCYAANARRFVFGGETHQVAAHTAVGNDIDPQSIYDYLFCQVVPAPGTIYRGVRKLLPAQYLLWSDGRLETGFYWSLAYHSHARASADELAPRFISLVGRAVADASSDGGRVATFLSGGTDSSTVTGMLGKARGAAPDAYSIGFAADGFDEMEYARIAAQHFGANHHPYYVTPNDVLHAIPKVAAAYDEPFGNASAVPAFYCARRARDDGFDTLLAGDGGDELFGGNARYAKQKIFEAYQSVPEPLRRQLIEPALLRLDESRWPGLLRKSISYVRQARIPLPDRLESYNFLMRESAAAMFEPEFLAAIDTHHPTALAREVYERADADSFIDRMMHLDLKLTLADNDLRKVNRMCELAGIAVRYPLLDESLVEFSGEVPADLKVRGLKLRYFFKYALRDFLPPETIKKAKQGFGLPFGVWLQEDAGLRDLAVASLRSFRSRGYLRPDYIDQLLRRHASEHASYYGVMIWVVLMLEQWLASHRQ